MLGDHRSLRACQRRVLLVGLRDARRRRSLGGSLRGSAASLAPGLVCLGAAGTLSAVIAQGAPSALNLLVLPLAFDGIRVALLAPAGVVWLVRNPLVTPQAAA